MKIYVASSWKNTLYYPTVQFLEMCGHNIMDWRKEKGFSWSQATPIPKENWSEKYYRDVVLQTTRAIEGFENDYSLMKKADACVLLLPCGRSAHLEAGWFVGQNKPLHIFMPLLEEPELMYKFAKSISFVLEDLALQLQGETV